MTLRIGPYRALEDGPAGHRSPVTQVWRAEDERSGAEVTLTVLPAVPAEIVERMVQLAGTVDHPHLLPVLDVPEEHGRVAVVSARPSGGRLGDLLERRGRLPASETLTVLRPLADALTAIHGAGLVHGNVSAESVWFDRSGRPMLGGLAAGLAAAQAATHGDAPPEGARDLAPEVARGAEPTAAADVFSLGSVALNCLTGRAAWPADDPADVLIQSIAGIWPNPPDDAGPPPLIALLRAMLDAEPADRPDAASLVTALRRAGTARPVDFSPDATVAREPLFVRRAPTAGSAAEPPQVPEGVATEHGGRPSDGRAPAEVGRAHHGRRSTRGRRKPRRGRHEQAARPGGDDPPEESSPSPGSSAAVRAVAVGAVAVVIGVGAVLAGLWWAGWDQATPTTVTAASPPRPSGQDWLTVIRGLDAARGRALATADPSLLAEVYTSSATERTADAAVLGELAGRHLSVRGGTHEIASVAELPAVRRTGTAGASRADPPAAAGGAAVRVAVVDSMPARPIIDAAGRQVGLTAASPGQRRILVLEATDAGYRIRRILPG